MTRLSKKRAFKHFKSKSCNAYCGYCLKRIWLGLKWGYFKGDDYDTTT